MHLDSDPEEDCRGLPAGRNRFCDKVRLAVTQAGIVLGAAAQNRSEEPLAEVAHKAHSFPADMSGGQKRRVLSSSERIMHRKAGRILREERNVLTAPNETSSFAEVPSAGAALRTRLRAQRNRTRFRGCRRTGARRGGFPGGGRRAYLGKSYLRRR